MRHTLRHLPSRTATWTLYFWNWQRVSCPPTPVFETPAAMMDSHLPLSVLCFFQTCWRMSRRTAVIRHKDKRARRGLLFLRRRTPRKSRGSAAEILDTFFLLPLSCDPPSIWSFRCCRLFVPLQGFSKRKKKRKKSPMLSPPRRLTDTHIHTNGRIDFLFFMTHVTDRNDTCGINPPGMETVI